MVQLNTPLVWIVIECWSKRQTHEFSTGLQAQAASVPRIQLHVVQRLEQRWGEVPAPEGQEHDEGPPEVSLPGFMGLVKGL